MRRTCQLRSGGITCGKGARYTLVFRVPGHPDATLSRASCTEHAHPSCEWTQDGLDRLEREVRL